MANEDSFIHSFIRFTRSVLMGITLTTPPIAHVLFDIRALWRSDLSVRVPGCQKLQMMALPSLHNKSISIWLQGV